jgi:hypothetical protein
MSVFAGTNLLPSGTPVTIDELAPVSDELKMRFLKVIDWINRNGWGEFFRRELGVNLTLTGELLTRELIRDIDKTDWQKLASLKRQKKGFDDFAGKKLLTPGSPSLSLLYHALASPRVKPFGNTQHKYPSIEQLDSLENYIYALQKWQDYKFQKNDELVLAVFAYEYRPALKTPHHAHADFVYSRTGIARIGDQPHNYDEIKRCYSNKPKKKRRYHGKNDCGYTRKIRVVFIKNCSKGSH